VRDVIDELDVTEPGFFLRDDFDEVTAWLRRHDPVHELADGTWLVTTYNDIRTVSSQPTTFSSAQGALINDPMRGSPTNEDSGSLVHLDPPRHAEYRKLLNRRFTPRAVGGMEGAVRAAVDDVLSELRRGDEIDLVGQIAAPIPVAVIAELLGIADASRADFRRWSDAAIGVNDHPDDQDVVAATVELFRFLDGHIRAREAEPGDDLISALVTAEDGGAPLTRPQIGMFCLTLLVAGNETTRSLVSGGLHALAGHPEQRAALAADPSLLVGAVEECLRWVTPVQAFCRTTTGAVDLSGTAVPAGAYLAMLYASGNRDEAAFGPTAHDFDITRSVSPTHVAFGFGEHLCLGASLARLEARIVYEEVLDRFPRYTVTGPPTYVRSTITHSIDSLPVRLD
jgi:cytochrome P450